MPKKINFAEMPLGRGNSIPEDVDVVVDAAVVDAVDIPVLGRMAPVAGVIVAEVVNEVVVEVAPTTIKELCVLDVVNYATNEKIAWFQKEIGSKKIYFLQRYIQSL